MGAENEFSRRWGQLSKRQRVQVKKSMQVEAANSFSIGMRMHLSGKQLRAAAKNKVAMAIGRARTVA